MARQKANILSEAEQVARALEILLARAHYPVESVSDLVRDIAREQRVQLQKSYGRIEPRTRFKSITGHPLHLRLPINNLYVDESGMSIVQGPEYPPYFAIGAVAIGEKEAERYREAADEVKQRYFGQTAFQFHEPHMRQRRQSREVDYSFNRDENTQERFDASIDRLIRGTEFLAFGVAVRKDAFQRDFVDAGIDPYLPTDAYTVAITLLLERYVDALANIKPMQLGRVKFESIGPREDAYHQLEYARLLLDGTQWVSSSAFQSRLEAGLTFSPKTGSDPSELADFLSRDLFEWARSGCVSSPKWWDAFCSNVYVRGDGLMGKFGIKVFPDSDIRDRIEEHRRQYGAMNLP